MNCPGCALPVFRADRPTGGSVLLEPDLGGAWWLNQVRGRLVARDGGVVPAEARRYRRHTCRRRSRR